MNFYEISIKHCAYTIGRDNSIVHDYTTMTFLLAMNEQH